MTRHEPEPTRAYKPIDPNRLKPGDLITTRSGNTYRAVESATDPDGTLRGWDVDVPDCDGPRLYVPRSRIDSCKREYRTPDDLPGLWRDADGTLWLNDGHDTRAVWTERDGWGRHTRPHPGPEPYTYVEVPGNI